MAETTGSPVMFEGGCLNGMTMRISPGRSWLNWPEVDADGVSWVNTYEFAERDGEVVGVNTARFKFEDG